MNWLFKPLWSFDPQIKKLTAYQDFRNHLGDTFRGRYDQLWQTSHNTDKLEFANKNPKLVCPKTLTSRDISGVSVAEQKYDEFREKLNYSKIGEKKLHLKIWYKINVILCDESIDELTGFIRIRCFHFEL